MDLCLWAMYWWTIVLAGVAEVACGPCIGLSHWYCAVQLAVRHCGHESKVDEQPVKLCPVWVVRFDSWGGLAVWCYMTRGLCCSSAWSMLGCTSALGAGSCWFDSGHADLCSSRCHCDAECPGLPCCMAVSSWTGWLLAYSVPCPVLILLLTSTYRARKAKEL